MRLLLTFRLVNPGGSATFTVGASGAGPFSYQWRFNSSLIQGAASSSLLLNNIQHTNGGTYAVIVSNAAGSTTSQAELYVRPVLSAVISNSVLVLTVQSTPGKTYSVQTSTNATDWAEWQALNPAAPRVEMQTPVTPGSRQYRLR